MGTQVCSNHDTGVINGVMLRGQIFDRLKKENDFKILLLNCKWQGFDVSYEASLRHEDSTLFK